MTAFLQALLNGISDGAMLALVALGLTLVFGVARFPNVAHGEFLTLGAYGAYWCATLLGLPLLVSIAGGIGLAVVAGLAAYALVFRRIADRPVTALLASIGLSITLRGFIVFVAGTQQVSYDIPLWGAWSLGGITLLPLDVLVTVASFVVILFAHLVLRYSRIGVEMRAVADNPELARTSGIAPGRVNRATWSLALGVAALAGMFVAAKTSISPDLGWDLLLPAFAAAVLGGLGSPYGAIFAGLLIGIAQNIATLWISETYKVSFSFIILIAVLLLRPSGISGRKEVAR
ncbi:MAG: branched-chain amino acid ABC transporter permease [Janthinobacterium lividum]